MGVSFIYCQSQNKVKKFSPARIAHLSVFFILIHSLLSFWIWVFWALFVLEHLICEFFIKDALTSTHGTAFISTENLSTTFASLNFKVLNYFYLFVILIRFPVYYFVFMPRWISFFLDIILLPIFHSKLILEISLLCSISFIVKFSSFPFHILSISKLFFSL